MPGIGADSDAERRTPSASSGSHVTARGGYLKKKRVLGSWYRHKFPHTHRSAPVSVLFLVGGAAFLLIAIAAIYWIGRLLTAHW
jgi:hypothetical protein